MLICTGASAQPDFWNNPDKTILYSLSGDMPVTGGFDGGSKSNLTVWRPFLGSTIGTWFSLNIETEEMRMEQWGLAQDVPVGVGIKDSTS